MSDPVLWKYKTAKGEDAVTDRWEDIPHSQRSHAQPFSTQAEPPHAELAVLPALSGAHFEPLSFAGGALLGALVALVFARRQRFALKLALGLVVLVLGAGAYLAFLRREVGSSNNMLTSPQAIIGDVHGAADAMKAHLGDQQKALEKVEASEK